MFNFYKSFVDYGTFIRGTSDEIYCYHCTENADDRMRNKISKSYIGIIYDKYRYN